MSKEPNNERDDASPGCASVAAVSPHALDDMPSLCLRAVTQNVTRLFYLSSNDRESGDKRPEVRHIIALNSPWYASYQLRGPVYKKSYLITAKGFNASLHIEWYDMASSKSTIF